MKYKILLVVLLGSFLNASVSYAEGWFDWFKSSTKTPQVNTETPSSPSDGSMEAKSSAPSNVMEPLKQENSDPSSEHVGSPLPVEPLKKSREESVETFAPINPELLTKNPHTPPPTSPPSVHTHAASGSNLTTKDIKRGPMVGSMIYKILLDYHCPDGFALAAVQYNYKDNWLGQSPAMGLRFWCEDPSHYPRSDAHKSASDWAQVRGFGDSIVVGNITKAYDPPDPSVLEAITSNVDPAIYLTYGRYISAISGVECPGGSKDKGQKHYDYPALATITVEGWTMSLDGYAVNPFVQARDTDIIGDDEIDGRDDCHWTAKARECPKNQLAVGVVVTGDSYLNSVQLECGQLLKKTLF